MSRILWIRISDNVLSRDDWPIGIIAFDETGHISAISVTHKGVYRLPNCVGWDFSQLTTWQNYDATGVHPETYYEVSNNGSEWHYMITEYELRVLASDVPATCSICDTMHGTERDCRQSDIDDCAPGYMRSDRYQL